MNPQTYKVYTGKDNDQVKKNLGWLIHKGYANKIICRIPLIPQYNNDNARELSINELKQMGITRFNKFNYIIRDQA